MWLFNSVFHMNGQP